MVKASHSKKGPATEDRCSGHPGQSKYKSCYCCGATPSHPKEECPAKDAEWFKCWKKGHFKNSCRREKRTWEIWKTWENQSLQKSMNWVHKQQWDNGHSSSVQFNGSKWHTTAHLPRVKSLKQHSTICRLYRSNLNKQEDNKHIQSLWVSIQLDAQVHQFDSEINSGGGCSIIPMYIYRSLLEKRNQSLPQFSSMDRVTSQ